MKKILNKRLERISAFINDNECVCDIGCDHALLGIYLVLNKKNIRMISSDINEKPLLKAKDNIIKFNVENQIELRMGNGLEIITNDVTTIVISGMGGITMTNILEKINYYHNVKKLILSPNNDFPLVRKKLANLGFKIMKEEIVYEKGKYYLIASFIKGREKTNYYFGKLDLTNQVVRDYYQSIYTNNMNILKRMSFIQKIKRLDLFYTMILIRKKLKS